jgi:hypothetical protein
MPSRVDVYTELTAAGVVFRAAGAQLLARQTTGKMSDAHRTLIRTHKAGILAVLQAAPAVPRAAPLEAMGLPACGHDPVFWERPRGGAWGCWKCLVLPEVRPC